MSISILQRERPLQTHSIFSSETSLFFRDKARRRQLVNVALLLVTCFQVVDLIGAILGKSSIALVIVVSGLVVCGCAFFLNSKGKLVAGSMLLILVIDLGCGLLLLSLPNNQLDGANFPVYDILVVSELISVALLPAASVFVIAFANIVFILGDVIFQPHTAALNQSLASGMTYQLLSQPIGLQIVVAFLGYMLVRSTLIALARADRAEEIAELHRREAERTRQLEIGIHKLLETQVRAANGDRTVRADLPQDNILWQVGVSFNLLLTRLQKAMRLENENQRLRAEVARLADELYLTRRMENPRQ